MRTTICRGITRLLRGNKLTPDDQRFVLETFTHRMTDENIRKFPAFAGMMRANGYRMPEMTEAQWLAVTDFYVNRAGRLLRGKQTHCFSHPEEISEQHNAVLQAWRNKPCDSNEEGEHTVQSITKKFSREVNMSAFRAKPTFRDVVETDDETAVENNNNSNNDVDSVLISAEVRQAMK